MRRAAAKYASELCTGSFVTARLRRRGSMHSACTGRMRGYLLFGDVVRAHRRRLGLTQEGLATASGLSVRNIRAIESGQVTSPRQATVRLLATAFRLEGLDRKRFYAAIAEPAPIPTGV
ncbi:multiprotein-bridging factor 1 family protein [Phytohabitans flavus]|uniref:helix-turn-helix domain-containing protein n=1 Tax=Phytohabitans flavus TaxID=1076124 RepID=UPI003632DE87